MKEVDRIRKIKVVTISIFLVIILANLVLILFMDSSEFTGNDISSVGSVIFEIEPEPFIYILSPENITYNFSLGSYSLDLNVSFNTGMSSWIFDLYDNKHGEWVYQNVGFSPNISFNAVRWSNTLHVNATSVAGKLAYDNVTFYVYVNNSAPILYDVNETIYVCESDSLYYPFYAIDVDEDENPLVAPYFDGLVHSSLSNNHGKFFASDFPLDWYRTRFNFSVYSAPLVKGDAININERVRNYSTSVQVSDGEYSDSKDVNISVLEINNPPVVEDISVQTMIWNQGENSTFFEVIDVSDIEYGLGHGSLTFNISIKNSSGQNVNLFGIDYNGTNWYMNFTANSSVPLGVYDVRICVLDTGLSLPSPLLPVYCNQTGGQQFSCDDFSITITDENRAPTITDYRPANLTFNSSGTNHLYFNITSYDPDGTIPDAYWFVDGGLSAYHFNNITDSFDYIFGCGISGVHTVKAEISDGLLNDSVQWNITVEAVDCPISGPGGGGGGGGGGGAPICISNWACNPWMVCQNTALSLDQGLLSGLNYRLVQDACDDSEYDERVCGFQIRDCVDVNSCGRTIGQPEEVTYCLYSENPSCRDGLKNCHNGSCELLVDCGGPCGTCPSCSDGIRNQGEDEVDCGGPCPWQCVPAVPLLKRTSVIYGFLILLLLLVVFIIYKLVRVLQYKRKLGEQTRDREI